MSAVEALAEDGWRIGQFVNGAAVSMIELYVRTGHPTEPWTRLSDGRTYPTIFGITPATAEQVAELIDGETEVVGTLRGSAESFRSTWTSTSGSPTPAPGFAATHHRAVGPWLPLGVSPETNGEQK